MENSLEETESLSRAQQTSCISLPVFLLIHPPALWLFPVPISLVLGAAWGGRGLAWHPPRLQQTLLCRRRSELRSTRPGGRRASQGASQWRRHRYRARLPPPVLPWLQGCLDRGVFPLQEAASLIAQREVNPRDIFKQRERSVPVDTVAASQPGTARSRFLIPILGQSVCYL